mgnify:FL=1
MFRGEGTWGDRPGGQFVSYPGLVRPAKPLYQLHSGYEIRERHHLLHLLPIKYYFIFKILIS